MIGNILLSIILVVVNIFFLIRGLNFFSVFYTVLDIGVIIFLLINAFEARE
jgi:hypothetical protein